MQFTGVSLIVLIVAILGAGVVLWGIPADQLEMAQSAFLLRWVLAATAVAVASQLLLRGRRGDTAPLVTTGFILAVLARVIYESQFREVDHNLWPIEVAIAGVVGVVGGMIGAAVGVAWDQYAHRRNWK